MDGSTKLRRYLKANRITQEDLAAQAGLDGPQISQWLKGPRRPGLASALKLEAATGGFISPRDWTTPRKARKSTRAA